MHGRKKMQKLIYLLKVSGFEINNSFEWNYYGPYSEELAMDLDKLNNSHIIKEEINNISDYMEYSYSLTPVGLKFISILPDDEKINIDLIKKLNARPSKELEKYASIIYLLNKGYQKDIIYDFLFSQKGYSKREVDHAISHMNKRYPEIMKNVSNI